MIEDNLLEILNEKDRAFVRKVEDLVSTYETEDMRDAFLQGVIACIMLQDLPDLEDLSGIIDMPEENFLSYYAPSDKDDRIN